MRAPLAIALFSMVVAATLPAVAQPPAQPAPPTAPAQQTEPTKPAVEPKTARATKVRRRHRAYTARHRHESICSIVNGWRAFNNRYDPKGYFYTGRVCCCG
jgi:hypothetical protein